jgi:DNA mismatch repair ATPase MutL
LQVDQIETARAQLNSSGFTFVIKNRSVLKILKCPSHFKKNFGLEEFLQIVDTNKNIKDIPSFYNAAASKACRSAVMIGDELIRNKMIDIVHRMSDLKSPWNCPHGRPSLISLGNFKSIISKIKSQKHVYKF